MADVERSEHEMQLIQNTLRAPTTVFGEINQGQESNGNGPPQDRINYLDITIHKTPTNINISIYRKPTFTDTLNSYTSNNHPIQQNTQQSVFYTTD